MEKMHTQQNCSNVHLAIQDTLYVVSGKWKLVILAILVNDGKMRFGELSRYAGISPRILSRELQDMEMNKLVSRTVMSTKPVTVEYAATEYADSLKEVINAMIKWGQNHREAVKRG